MTSFAARISRAVAAAAIAATLVAGPARAQTVETYVFLAAISERGLACELLNDWEAATVDAELDRMAYEFDESERQQLPDLVAAEAAETPCDDPAMVEWIGAAKPGIGQEWLPPYLAIFRSFALMPEPPEMFIEMVEGVDLAEAVAAIDAGFEALEAEGILAEGGVAWNDFTAEVDAVAELMVAAITGEGDPAFPAEEAIIFITSAATVVPLWLAGQ